MNRISPFEKKKKYALNWLNFNRIRIIRRKDFKNILSRVVQNLK